MNGLAALRDFRESDLGTAHPYLHLANALRRSISEGNLKPGDRLPKVRELTELAGVSTNTVLRALAELSADGTIVTRRGAGSFIAPHRATCIEVITRVTRWPLEEHQAQFYSQLMEGIQGHYAPDEQRVWLSHPSNGFPSADEIVGVCRSRRTAGVIVYRPHEEHFEALRQAARQVPIVSLFVQVPDAPIDALMPAEGGVLRGWMIERFRRGCRAFAYAGQTGRMDVTRMTDSSYAALYHVFVDTARELGVTPQVQISRLKDWTPACCESFVRKAGENAVILATLWELADKFPHLWPTVACLSYTESKATLAMARKRLTMIYLPINNFGRRAAELLEQRIAWGAAPPAQRVDVAPEIIEQERTTG